MLRRLVGTAEWRPRSGSGDREEILGGRDGAGVADEAGRRFGGPAGVEAGKRVYRPQLLGRMSETVVNRGHPAQPQVVELLELGCGELQRDCAAACWGRIRGLPLCLQIQG
jgi:hypothetical protein